MKSRTTIWLLLTALGPVILMSLAFATTAVVVKLAAVAWHHFFRG